MNVQVCLSILCCTVVVLWCSQDKDVAHFWELGGGTWLSKLADLVITTDALRSVVEDCLMFLADDCLSLDYLSLC